MKPEQTSSPTITTKKRRIACAAVSLALIILCCCIVIAVVLAIIIILIVFSIPLAAEPTAFEYLVSRDDVRVTKLGDNKWYLFENINTTEPLKNLFIFYAGGRVDERAYAPLLFNLTKNSGFSTVLVGFPLYLAFTKPDAALDIIKYLNQVHASEQVAVSWAIGGHSLGGYTATEMIATSWSSPSVEGKLRALVLYSSFALKNLREIIDTIPFYTLIMRGTKDSVTDVEKLENFSLYPKNTTSYVEIPGGNHAGFAMYGKQPGDTDADISTQEQIAITVAETTSILKNAFL